MRDPAAWCVPRFIRPMLGVRSFDLMVFFMDEMESSRCVVLGLKWLNFKGPILEP